MHNQDEANMHLTIEELTCLGTGQVAYVREVHAEDIAHDFPDAGALCPEARLFVLHGADGVPIMLSDDREMILASARANSLEPVSLH